MNRLLLLSILTGAILVSVSFRADSVSAQDACVQYQVIPRTIYEAQKVTDYREVMETQYKTERTTSWKPVYTLSLIHI